MQMLTRLVECLPRSWLLFAIRARRESPFFERSTNWLADQLRSHDTVIRTGIAAGLLFNTGRSNASYCAGTKEPDVERALANMLGPGMAFYDIGAHFGFFSLMAARIVGSKGAILSFEPLPENYRLLEHNASANGFRNIRCLPVAVGAADGEGRFFVSTDPSQGMLASDQKQPDQRIAEIIVEVRRLDNMIAKNEIPPPHAVKIDIEGGEVAALAGAANMLSIWRPVLVIELHDTGAAVMRELDRHGYEACLFGSRVPIELARGNLHTVAIPYERQDRTELLERFRDPRFPCCNRCHSFAAGQAGTAAHAGREATE